MINEGLFRALVRDQIKERADSQKFFTYLEEGGEPSYKRCLDILRDLRVLIAGEVPESVREEVYKTFGSLYEKLALRLRKEGLRGIFQTVSLRRVGKEEVRDLSEVEDSRVLSELILNHFVKRHNVLEILDDLGEGHLEGIKGEDSLLSKALFPEKEEQQGSILSKILSDVGFRWYIDWCGDRLGFGKGFLKNLQRLPSMTTIELIDLFSKMRKVHFHADSSKYSERIAEVISILRKVIEWRILSARSGKKERRDPRILVLDFPEAFTGEERGFDLIITADVSGSKGVRAFLEQVTGLLKEDGRIIALVPFEFTFAEEWKEARKRLREGILRLERDSESLLALVKRTEASGESGPILILDSDRERRVIEEIREVCGKTLGEVARIERGLRIRRFVSEEGNLEAVFPEDISNYRVSGPLKKLNLRKAGEKVIKKAEALAVPKVLLLRRAEFSEIPGPHLKVIACADTEGSVPADGLLALVPKDTGSDLFALAGWINSILFGWLIHRLSFNAVGRDFQLSEFYLEGLPVPDHLIENREFGELIRDIDPKSADFADRFLEAEREVLRALGLEAERMPLSYRKLLEDPGLVKI